ncbi:aminoacyl-tRNA hydrolase [Actinopolymorpha sp. B17G11]|uniref:aminoacyl-tRNA hydrolase n=1 Tax=Actinopolymorpha sp. B17G11 TaxID=3160861 RepID=UPI0032E3F362
MADDAWLVVGLGNPGPTYAAHRHNVGHLVLDLLAERMGGNFRPHPRGRADVLEGRLGGLPGQRVVLAKPRSYMNTSGGPVASLGAFYKLDPARLVVVHDELDIPYSTLRLKFGGGDNGHNGLRSIRRSIGTGEFFRVRCGIGRPPGRQDAASFVLSPFSSVERKELPLFVERAGDAVETLTLEGLEKAQNAFHGEGMR